ncbi:MAG: acyl-CoA dehydrogenase [Leifsonia sp.]
MSAQRILREDAIEVGSRPGATIRPVRIGEPLWDAGGSPVARTLQRVPDADAGIDAVLAWCVDVGRAAPAPGLGDTASVWEILASVAAHDLGIARMLEPHLDALTIIEQAGIVDPAVLGAGPTSTWGVFAAEGPGVRVTARYAGGDWRLDGVKPWCSLAGTLTNALVTAHTDDGSRRLFAVDLGHAGVTAADGPWVSRGLAQVVSAPVTFSAVPAVPVGEDGWYLRRPGFAWGGIGVAACWWGGTVGLARTLFSAAAGGSKAPDQIALAHLGAVDLAVESGRIALREAGRHVDGIAADSPPPGVIARRTRSIVAANAESALLHVAHALGPLPLVADESHARRVADLQVYLRQHHAERDEAALGSALLETGELPW